MYLNSLNVNPLNANLNPICYLLALLAHHFLHVSRIRVKNKRKRNFKISCSRMNKFDFVLTMPSYLVDGVMEGAFSFGIVIQSMYRSLLSHDTFLPQRNQRMIDPSPSFQWHAIQNPLTTSRSARCTVKSRAEIFHKPLYERSWS